MSVRAPQSKKPVLNVRPGSVRLRPDDMVVGQACTLQFKSFFMVGVKRPDGKIDFYLPGDT